MGMQGMIPPNIDYSKSVSDGYQKKTYKKGETCIKYNKLYQAEEDIDEPEEWNPEHWKETTVEQIRAQVQQEIETVNTKISNITPDDTAVDGKPWTSKHIVDMLCPPLKVSGNPVQCYPVAGYPLGITASWEPTQEGTGDPSPDNIRLIKGRDSVAVTRCGANILDPADFEKSKTVNGITFNKFNNGSVEIKGTSSKTSFYNVAKYFPSIVNIEKDGAYVFGDYIVSVTGLTDGVTFIRPSDKTIMYIRVNAKSTVNTIVYIQIEIGSVATEYTPYTGDTTTLTLPETIYGGSVDAVTGQGQKEWMLLTLDGSEIWEKDNNGALNLHVKHAGIRGSDYIKCNIIKSEYSYSGNGLYVANGEIIRFETGFGSSYATISAWKSYLAGQRAAGTPVQIAYKLATPESFSATGNASMPAISGINTVLTDADSVKVTGRADPVKRITDLEDAVASITTS